MSDDELRTALQVAVERDAAAAPAFSDVVTGRPRQRRVRWMRAAIVVAGLAVGAFVLRPRSSASLPVAVAPVERDPLLASATGSFLIDGTPDFTSSFALAREIASY